MPVYISVHQRGIAYTGLCNNLETVLTAGAYIVVVWLSYSKKDL